MDNVRVNRFSIICNMDGMVLKIIHDESGILPVDLKGKMFFSLVVPSELDKVFNFFLELKKNLSAIGWEINVSTKDMTQTFTFFGGVFEDTIGIAAATNESSAHKLFSELTRINNEQANIIRSLSKDREKFRASAEEVPVSFYEELSSLNNELVNTQRELFKKNKELDELNRLKNLFLGMASHDLRNPLGNVLNYIELIEDEADQLSSDHLKFIGRIKDQCYKMLNLVNELLDYSVIESGKDTTDPQPENLITLILQVVESNKMLADQKSIKINTSFDENRIVVTMDGKKIHQVITNFITNAIKYSHPNTVITVEVKNEANKVTVCVHDQGQGIRQEEQDGLFQPFQKTSTQATGKEKSTGLGLFICKQIVENHHGTIWMRSTFGEGSSFCFSLPKPTIT